MHTPTQQTRFDANLIARYDTAGPRYTSYPTAVQFHEAFDDTRYGELAQRSHDSGRGLSLYVHIPFCDTVCYYCACNKVITRNRARAQPYLDRLHREIAMQATLLGRDRAVEQLHWGGGTPTFISLDQMRALMSALGEHFQLLPEAQADYSIEIDPREVGDETLETLRELGFNRISLGIQDLDPSVQAAVNRLQDPAWSLEVLARARAEGFHTASIDLIYGLPRQSAASFARTVAQIAETGPDRISVFNYAHLPERFKPQRQIRASELPDPHEKLMMLGQTVGQLSAAGYVYIGMDHFARPEDELAVAQRDGTLYRNFQGYSTHAHCDLIGLGATAIGKVGGSYSQNVRDLEAYQARIDSGRLPIFRGVELNADDRLRRAVITRLICHFQLAFAEVEETYGIQFHRYFAPELQVLETMAGDGLLELDGRGLVVTSAGRLLIRNICMVFDRYLAEQPRQRFSRVI